MVFEVDSRDAESCSSDDSDIVFAHMDFEGVIFDDEEISSEEKNDNIDIEKNEDTKAIAKNVGVKSNDSTEKSVSKSIQTLKKVEVDGIEATVDHGEQIENIDIPFTRQEGYDASAEILDLNTSDLNVISIDEVESDPAVMDTDDIEAIEEENRVILNIGTSFVSYR